jgi:hypothetical protein
MQCGTEQKTQKKLQILKERIRRYPLTSGRFFSNTTMGGLTRARERQLTAVLVHPPHSTDLNPFNVNLSRKWRIICEDIISCQDDEVKTAAKMWFHQQDAMFYRVELMKLPKYWQSVWTTGVYVKQ